MSYSDHDKIEELYNVYLKEKKKENTDLDVVVDIVKGKPLLMPLPTMSGSCSDTRLVLA